MEHTVTLRYLRISPRKVRRVADLVRGKHVNVAEANLILNPARSAKPLLKLLRSAVAGAKQKKLNEDKLVIQTIRVDQGPMLKRYMPRAQGSSSEIQKKASHITLVLNESAVSKKPYSIIVKKKIKKMEPEKGKKASRGGGKGPASGNVGNEEKTPELKKAQGEGFFRRVFRRKAGMGNAS